MIAKIDLTKLGRNCAVAITQDGGSITQTYVEDSANIEISFNQNNNTVTVTILGNLSATTKDITTGTYLTIDTGSGAVTINSYNSFKTNYALLFLNGGSASTPTLDAVLNAGNTSQVNINITNGSTLNTDLNNNGLLTQNITGGYTYSTKYLYNGIDFNVSNEYSSKLLIPDYDGNVKNITNYLPDTSGTLLNGNFNSNNLGLFINYNDNKYTLGDDNTGRGVYIDVTNQTYSFGDTSTGIYLNMDLSTQKYSFGNIIDDFGLFLNDIHKSALLGQNGTTNIFVEGDTQTTTFQTENLKFIGTNLTQTGNGNPINEHLRISINGTPYIIQLRTP